MSENNNIDKFAKYLSKLEREEKNKDVIKEAAEFLVSRFDEEEFVELVRNITEESLVCVLNEVWTKKRHISFVRRPSRSKDIIAPEYDLIINSTDLYDLLRRNCGEIVPVDELGKDMHKLLYDFHRENEQTICDEFIKECINNVDLDCRAMLGYEIDDIASFSLYNIKKRGFSSCINRGLWVDFIYVKPEKRRRGYFTKMIKYFEELLYDINSCLQNENPVECIELLVYKTNNNAVRQYQRLGFIEEPSVEFDGCCMHMVKYFRSKLRHFT